MNVTKINFFIDQFNDKFKNFNKSDAVKISAERELDDNGDPKASALIVEIAILSAFFAGKSLKESMTNEDASYAAYLGWQLSDEMIHGDDKATARLLTKLTKRAQKYYKLIGIKLSVSALSWLIFCCAMIREIFYSEFHYEMLAYLFDDEDEKVKVIFKKPPILKPEIIENANA